MSDRQVIIGLCGELKSGKDATFEALRKVGFVGAVRMAFADPLKHELAEALGIPVTMIGENKSAFRLGLQWYGTEYRRGLYGQDYWVKIAASRLAMSRAELVVFTDVRFPNEVDFIRAHGGYIWQVKRRKTLWAWLKSLFAWKHQSEQLKTKPDYVIRNYGTLEDLKARVQEAWDATIEKDGGLNAR